MPDEAARDTASLRVDDLYRRAAAVLPPPVTEYFISGARAGLSAAEAVAAWDAIRFRPRMLRNVSAVSTATSVLGQPVATPVLVGPTAMQKAAHPRARPRRRGPRRRPAR